MLSERWSWEFGERDNALAPFLVAVDRIDGHLAPEAEIQAGGPVDLAHEGAELGRAAASLGIRVAGRAGVSGELGASDMVRAQQARQPRHRDRTRPRYWDRTCALGRDPPAAADLVQVGDGFDGLVLLEVPRLLESVLDPIEPVQSTSDLINLSVSEQSV